MEVETDIFKISVT